MKKTIIILFILMPFLSLAQDKVINLTINQPTALSVLGGATPATGNGLSNGSVNISVSGGTLPYTYLWSNGSQLDHISGLPSGNYSVTVTDYKGCTATFSDTVTEPALLTVGITNPIEFEIDCFGNNNGQLVANAEGGAGGNSYLWAKLISGSYQNIGIGSTISSQSTGQYRVTVTDANNNTAQNIFTLNQPSQLVVNFTKTDVLCFGAKTGSINLTITGGTGPYTVDWLDIPNNDNTEPFKTPLLASRINLSAGDYAYSVSDAKGCTVKNYFGSEIKIIQPPALVITTPTNGIQNPTSNGARDGSISIVVSGGSGSYEYLWNNGDTGSDRSGLSDGTYTVTVTDIPNNCTKTATFTLNEPPPFSVSITTPQVIKCNGETGILQATAKGGVLNLGSSYNYAWFDISSGTQIPIGITTATISNLVAGNYRVIATDNNGNITSADQSITEPSTLVFSGPPSSNNVSCFGGNDGAASVTVSDGTGTPLYTYVWTKTGDANYSASTPSINNLTAGVYNLTVTDANMCTINTSVTITEPSSSVSISLIHQTNVSINNQSTGSIDINVSGGTPLYNYLWTKTGDSNFNETTPDLTNINAGEYSVTVSDNNSASSSNSGCIATQTFTITEPLALNVSIDITNPISCFGDTNGQLTAIVTGGVKPYSYSWFKILDNIPSDLERYTPTINELLIGEYQIQVTDANGASTNNTITLTEPSVLLANIVSTTNVNCFGELSGSIDIDVSGGTEDYYYSWSDANGTLSYNTQDLQNIPIGNYSVSIQDNNGCSVALNSIIITGPNKPLSIEPNPTIIDASGNGLTNGSIEVMVDGGTMPYTYLWKDTFNTTLSSNTNVLSNISTGNYYLTVTDANNCTLGPVEYLVKEPAPLIAPLTTIPIECFGEMGTLTTNVSGGVAPYSYNWFNVLDNTVPLSNTNSLTTISGNYTLVVRDSNGNENIQNIILSEPDKLVITATQTNVLCYGAATGNINLLITGGTGDPDNYTYNWSNAANTQNISELTAGTYSVTVRDENFCEATFSITITQPNNPISIASTVITDTKGYGLTDGRIEVTVTGGTPPYKYLWMNEVNTTLASTSNILSNISAGSYFLTVTDANNCTLDPIKYVVNQPDQLTNSFSTIPIACFGETGTLTTNVSGGVAPYSYNWFNVLDNTVSLSNTKSLTTISGNYTLIVTDSNGNENTQNITLTEPPELIIDAIITNNVTCYNGSNGSIEINASGGTGDYSYIWSNNGSIINTQNGLTAGNYNVIITDDSGCSVSSNSITILQPQKFSITESLLIRPTDTNTSDGSISIDISGGVSPFTYEWFDSLNTSLQLTSNETSSSNSINNLNEGTYTIVITDNIGCSFSTDYNLANPGELLLSVNIIQPISCFGGNNGILSVTTIGGAGGNNYTWYNALNNSQIGNAQTLNNVAAGSYYVIVSNADGLKEQSAVIQVTDPDTIIGSLSQTNPTCFSNNDGSITISATGGSGVYEYNYQINNSGYTNWIPFDNNNSTQITMLVAGNYDIRIRDSIGCFYEQNGVIGTISTVLTQPDNLLIDNAILNNPTGFGLTNGSIEITTIGGMLPYTYLWSDTNGTLLETTNTLSNIGIGDYTVLITDFNNCTIQQTYTLTQPQKLQVTLENINIVLCHGDNGASLNALVSGGVFPYSYEWFETGNTAKIGSSLLLENLTTGSYYAIITDANSNSIQSAPFVISQPDTLEVSLFSDFVFCGDGDDWEITSNITGGTAPYTYTWSNGSSDSNLSNVMPDIYVLTVTDANGCLQSESINLVPPTSLAIYETLKNPTCYQGSDGSIEPLINGGTLPYTFSWSNGENTNNISNLTVGSYQLTVTDFKGCELTETFTLIDPDKLILDLGEDITLCADQTYILDAEIPNAISYQWTSNNGFSSTNQIVELSQEGIYTVIVTNNEGCIATDEIVINLSDQIINAEFLVSTQVFVNEIFYIIDDSDPIPDNIAWILPKEAELISESSTFAEIKFDTAGEYEITMITNVGNCTDIQTKTILVLDKEEFLEEESNNLDPIISKFTIFPNPSDGNFNVNIELREILPITLKIFGLMNNSMIDYKTFEGNSSYQTNYNINVPSGLYFVVLETAFATQLQKIIIE